MTIRLLLVAATGLLAPFTGCTNDSTVDSATPTTAVSTSAPDDVASPWENCGSDVVLASDAERVGEVDLDGDSRAETLLWIMRTGALTDVIATVAGRVVSSAPVGVDVLSPEVMAVADLDGRGAREVFLGGVGNTARSALVLTLDGCELRPVHSGTEDPFLLLLGVGGNGCAPTGCAVANRCEEDDSGRVLLHLATQPIGGGAGSTIVDPPIALTTTSYQLLDGTMTVVETATEDFPSMSQLPTNSPSMSDSDGVQC